MSSHDRHTAHIRPRARESRRYPGAGIGAAKPEAWDEFCAEQHAINAEDHRRADMVTIDRFEHWWDDGDHDDGPTPLGPLSKETARWIWRAALAAQPAEAQQEPVAWRHSKTGRLYDSVEEVPLADGDEWAEPLYATPATQQAPAAWRQWSTKLHDWDYSTNRGDLRSDTPADPLFVAAAQPVPLTDEQRNDCIEAWSSKGWGDRLGEVVRICIAIERAHGIAAAGDKP